MITKQLCGPFGEPLRFVLIIGSLMAVFDGVYIAMLAKTEKQTTDEHG